MRATTARNINNNKKGLSPEQCEQLLRAWKARFEKNMNRHKGLEWEQVQRREYQLGVVKDGKGKWPDLALAIPSFQAPTHIVVMDESCSQQKSTRVPSSRAVSSNGQKICGKLSL